MTQIKPKTTNIVKKYLSEDLDSLFQEERILRLYKKNYLPDKIANYIDEADPVALYHMLDRASRNIERMLNDHEDKKIKKDISELRRANYSLHHVIKFLSFINVEEVKK
jgi:hypothetical protein